MTTRRGAGGRAGEWFLDDVGGTIVETALDAIVGEPATDDDRSREQRRADALVTMASRVLQVGADRNGAQIRPHLALIVEEQTWAALLARRAAIETADRAAIDAAAGFTGAAFGLGPDGLPRARGTLNTADPTNPDGIDGTDGGRDGCLPPRPLVLPGLPPLPNVPPAELEDGSLVPGGELERIVCDCQVTRIVMDAASVPLDVGQTQRLYNREMRRAVTARDRHCQWPGCSIRAAWCEVHHVWFYANGGPTSLCNGCTLCVYHHHRVHDDHIRITILADGFDFHYRDGRHLGTTQRPPRPSRASRATTTTGVSRTPGLRRGPPATTRSSSPGPRSWTRAPRPWRAPGRPPPVPASTGPPRRLPWTRGPPEPIRVHRSRASAGRRQEASAGRRQEASAGRRLMAGLGHRQDASEVHRLGSLPVVSLNLPCGTTASQPDKLPIHRSDR
ncbi:hypothetical protein [Georgenia yuyongxinii]